ncbi:exodeoxyribonuclease VII large subunit [Marinifilum caeruleilacunae]|uniref:Exodeoxyribonuclease 7 large subunit n=1 Tax=Marinifilum caeruleilacunae TaxID=2499076 RepID=A0ABX1WZ16_9BACT|nr:exodeoxyribonuclease VII large subunit [Marinifilum caeruleilacunae]NOU61349.1 exodeoxyribonuclease VII large subunit [Marinifilum caeruleilacunae]
MSNKGISLFQLNNRIKGVLNDAFESEIWIVAEISELRYNQNGHCYLELVEKDEETDKIIAKARATIWSYTFRMLKPYFETSTGQRFSSGIKVLIQVSIEFQEIYGYTLNIKDIDPSYTLGDIARRRREILNRLEEEGVLDMNKEIDFPDIPKCIAVISSPTAAGYEDFANQLENNLSGYKFHYKLFPAIMQGNQAEESIIEALDRINEYEEVFDLVVIIRGGGSTADLNCFDNYWLAFNIAQFPLPVISGIGHERDETIVDIVANVRVKTPTAAAEYLIDCFDEKQAYHERLQEEFYTGVNEILLEASENLNYLSNKFSPMVKSILEKKSNQLLLAREKLIGSAKQLTRSHSYTLENQKSKLKHGVEHRLVHEKNHAKNLQSKIGIRVGRLLENQKHKLVLHEQSVKYLNPENILQKGYTLTLKDGKIVKDIRSLSVNDSIETRFKDGSVESEIQKVNPKKHK